ncbi:MAG: hypothetical protein QXV74_03925 [Candidatus Bathyarchaeia archaeon]
MVETIQTGIGENKEKSGKLGKNWGKLEKNHGKPECSVHTYIGGGFIIVLKEHL